MKKILLFVLAYVMFVNLQAQVRDCGTMDVYDHLMQTDPNFAQNQQRIEQFTQGYVAAHSTQRSLPGGGVTIPVVVHVLYRSATDSLSVAQVQSQINRLNLDFNKMNSDTGSVPAVWRSRAANCNISFCLAQRDPSGNATTGIIWSRTTLNPAGSAAADTTVKFTAKGGQDAWPAASYLNIWTCNFTSTLLGYASFPGGAANVDGVVIKYTAFGDRVGTAAGNFNLGRTGTHEVGHWVNLRHIWGDGNSTNCQSDSVADTPPANLPNYGCPTFKCRVGAACTTDTNGQMFMNYMDYTNDACMYMFTAGQNTRLQAVFAPGGPRASITTSNGCTPVNTCPDSLVITSTGTTACTPITFTATVYHPAAGTISYQWTLNGNNVGTNSTTYSPDSLNPGAVVVCTSTRSTCTQISNSINITGGSPPSIFITPNTTNLNSGSPIVITSAVTGPGLNPSYTWYKNGAAVGQIHASSLHYGGALGNGDVIYATYTSGGCGGLETVTSNPITFIKSGSTAKDLTQFYMPFETGLAEIDPVGATIEVQVDSFPGNNPVTHPTRIENSPLSSYAPAYYIDMDFSQPATYIVTAQDGSIKIWTVMVENTGGSGPGYTQRGSQAPDDPSSAADDVKLYPNPANTYITAMLAGGDDPAVFTILDLRGRVMYNQQLPASATIQHVMDVSEYPTGIYIMNIAIGDRIVNRQFVITRQ